MSAPKPHRVTSGRRAGQCRDCGGYDARNSSQTCCRCALERYGDAGHQIALDPQRLLERHGNELWRQVAQGLSTGALRSGRFYVYVGNNDGGPLTAPMGDTDYPAGWGYPDAVTAQSTAGYLLAQRYSQAWVVTTVGCWNAAAPIEGGQP